NVTGNDTEATGSPTAVTDTLSGSATVSGNVTGIVNTTLSGSTDIGDESIVTTTKVTGLINNPTGSTSGQSSLSGVWTVADSGKLTTGGKNFFLDKSRYAHKNEDRDIRFIHCLASKRGAI
ncbi:hypothetical protein Tco_0198386, partial [Tanacetum coccineum]